MPPKFADFLVSWHEQLHWSGSSNVKTSFAQLRSEYLGLAKDINCVGFQVRLKLTFCFLFSCNIQIFVCLYEDNHSCNMKTILHTKILQWINICLVKTITLGAQWGGSIFLLWGALLLLLWSRRVSHLHYPPPRSPSGSFWPQPLYSITHTQS